jgi:hypothetical protein
MKLIRILLTLSLLGFLAAPALADGQGKAVGRACDKLGEPLLMMSQSGFSEELFQIIDNQEDWCGFWDQAHSIMFPQPPCPPIDFDTHTVVAVALGERPDSCYGVTVPCMQALGASGNIRVFVEEIVPDESCICLDVVVKPVSVWLIEQPVRNAKVRKQISILSCP